VTRGTSYENRGNLAPAFFDQIIRKYEGTRLGRQELDAELLEDTPGALWSHGSIEASRLRSAPEMTRVVVAIDPAVTSGEEADETGIVVAGKDKDGHGYVLADISGRYPPIEWARLAITAYATHGADRIVAEVNNGGDTPVRDMCRSPKRSCRFRLLNNPRPAGGAARRSRVHLRFRVGSRR
jgi:phage terminase large subunit-like protein